MSGRPRVVVTGAGVVSPLGDRPGDLFAALCRGESAIAPAQEVDLSAAMAGRAGSPIAGEVKGFDPRDYLGKKNFRPLDRTGRLATVAAELALADSGWDAEARAEHEVGLVLGTMFGSVRTIAEFDRRALTAGPNYAKPMDFANSVINAAAGQTAIWHDLRGINTTLSGGNTGGLGALGYAADLVAAGRAVAVLAGGADELCFESFYGFQQAGLLAGSSNGGPPRPVPLDARRNGFVPGEGAALLVLERADAAAARGARAHAVVAGHGSAFDPSRGRDEAAAVAALAAAVRQALADAGVEAGEVDLLSLSANGSVAGDAREVRALGEVFGDRLGEIPACAVKATLGEALGAAGGYQALAAVSALAEGRLPGVPTLEEAESGVPLPSLDRGERAVEAKVALVTGLDFDGSAVAVVLTRPS
ncbi:MAG TPA: beta-ketoacyl synthase N-terminal-like domain-containing protein [Thermoanaerobaculia bacterium]|nr:beta-ketoacyl synthase N-terminal-like domain-containing protein [Thermoanaerobaculia bacterium]